MLTMPRVGSVLLIEDNIGFRFLFREALEYLGYEAWEAEDGEAGVKLACEKLPDLILLDLMIPNLHGFEVLRILRANPQTKNIPIVVLSVSSELRNVQKSLALGANDYIVKGTESPEGIVRRSCRLLAKA